MRYYNSELSLNGTENEKLILELLGDVRKSITQSLAHLNNKYQISFLE